MTHKSDIRCISLIRYLVPICSLFPLIYTSILIHDQTDVTQYTVGEMTAFHDNPKKNYITSIKNNLTA